jgi:hypothetical protein
MPIPLDRAVFALPGGRTPQALIPSQRFRWLRFLAGNLFFLHRQLVPAVR